MRLFINGRFLTQRTTGVQRFAYQMCESLHKKGVDITVIVPTGTELKTEPEFHIERYGRNIGPLWEQIFLPLFMRRYKDSYLISFSGLGPVFKKRHIATIHDLSFYVNKEWFSAAYRMFYGLTTPILAKHCAAIITVSEFSKREIVRFLKTPSEKIHVIYNAVSDVLLSKVQDDSVIDPRFATKYILSVSSLDPRKNFKSLIKAFQTANIPDCKLLIIGGRQASFAGTGITTDNNANIEFLGHVDDDTLRQAYAGASLFVYPSLYEGFGIPPLEALSQNCPILVSDIDVLHEVLGNAAFYCNPYSIEDICNQIKNILSHPTEVKRKIKNATETLDKYGWDKSATRLIECLKTIK